MSASTKKILSRLSATINDERESVERTATILRLMRRFIVVECADYNKIGERLHVLDSDVEIEQNVATSGYDLKEVESGALIEHKSSYLKTTTPSPRVNAQLTPTIDRSLFMTARTLLAEKALLSRETIRVRAGTHTFTVHRPLWDALDKDIRRKMADDRGGMQISWHDARTNKDDALFVGIIAYRLEAARWLGKLCTPDRKFPKGAPSLNLGANRCKWCKKPHRILKLSKWTEIFAENAKISANSTLEELSKNIRSKVLEKFYTAYKCK